MGDAKQDDDSQVPEGDDASESEHQSPLTLEVLLPRLYRDPRYMLIGKTERFGREILSYVEGCTLLSATGDVKGQLLLNAEFETRGRPDGEHPYGKPSLVEYYLEKREDKLALTDEEYAALREESWQYYVRRNFGFLLEDWAMARNDAEHNLEIWDLVEQAEYTEAGKWGVVKWWPWTERDRAIAQALWDLEHSEPERAATELYRAQRSIQQFGERYAEQYRREEGDGRTLCQHMAQHLATLVDILRRENDLPISLDEQLDLAEAAGDDPETERLRAELIRRTMEEDE